MAQRKVRYGIIGAGMIANFHAKAIGAVEDAQLTAVCGNDPARAEAFARKHGIAFYNRFDMFLERAPIDAVTIATPTGLHADVAIPAARAGKHVLCEKPLDATPEKSWSIVEACRENGVILAPIFQFRFGAGAMKMKRAIDAGRFGRILFVSGHIKWWRSQEYYDSGAWRGTRALGGGGCLMNQSIHTIDLMIHFAGAPEQVFGYTATRTHAIEVEDNACAAIRFRNGALGVIEASVSCAPGFPLRIEVSGERGSAAIEGDSIVEWRFVDSDPGDAEILADIGKGGQLGNGASDPKAIDVEGHRLQIADLTRAILTASAPAIDGGEAVLPVELICGIYDSMKTGKPHVFGTRA
ncbi:MAG: Gfo/Idh/MocA family oxidoreductase [Candidatus Accumulibacter sp.]|nr:Gfo/Idh/MocA family oxidoreductase [Accumulibacter sp.]